MKLSTSSLNSAKVIFVASSTFMPKMEVISVTVDQEPLTRKLGRRTYLS